MQLSKRNTTSQLSTSLSWIIWLKPSKISWQKVALPPPQKIETIDIKKGKFFVNGDEIIGAAGQKCIQAYMANSDLTPEDMEKKEEEISIKIVFD